MKLTERDALLFYKLNWALLHYVNQKHRVIKKLKSPDLGNQNLEKVNKLLKIVFSQPDLIDRFVDDNPQGLKEEELEIVSKWKNFSTGRYLVMKHTKDHSMFMKIADETKVYGVVGLHDTIPDIIGREVPIMVETSLLPFKGRVVYCGFMFHSWISFGGSIKSSFKDGYKESVAKYGIITSIDSPAKPLSDSKEKLVCFYSSSEARRAQYAAELKALLEAYPDLKSLHFQEIGKSNSRRLKKRLSTLGTMDAWFAVLEDSVIASGDTEDQARKRAELIIPKERKDHLWVFRHRKKTGPGGGG